MIKLFEEYNKDQLIVKLFEKCKIFIFSVYGNASSNVYDYNGKQDLEVLWVTIKNSKNFDFHLTCSLLSENLHLTTSEEIYFPLFRYMINIFDDYLDYDVERNTYSLKNLTINTLNNINFDVEGYEIFKDSERFGL